MTDTRAPQAASRRDRLTSSLQHLLPQHTLSRLIHRLARVRWRPLRLFIIRTFIRAFGVDMSEALDSRADAYGHFNAFFTRRLKPSARPLAAGTGVICSPADGRISALGDIRDGQLLQAKGRRYTVSELLGHDPAAATFADGSFCTIYLSPRDYHRVHMPVDGTLTRMIHVPGRLFSVSPATTRAMPRLFARNERVACLFDGQPSAALVMVGAMLVGSIETVWAGEVTPPAGRRIQTWNYENGSTRLPRGGEMGRFNMGSTVILLFPAPGVAWDAGLYPDTPVRMGQGLGLVNGEK